MTGSEHDTPEVIGYTSALAVEPGERVDVMVSSSSSSVRASTLRLRHGDISPRGPGERAAPVDMGIAATLPGRRQVARPGSFARADVAIPAGGMTLQLWLMPTRPGGGARQGVFALDNGTALVIDGDGRLAVEVAGAEVVRTAAPVVAWAWLGVAVVVDPLQRIVALHAQRTAWPRKGEQTTGELATDPPAAAELVLGALAVDRSGPAPARTGGYDGRIEAPKVFFEAVAVDGLPRLATAGVAAVAPDLAWRFEQRAADAVVPAAIGAAPLELFQAPQRLVLGHDDRADALGDVPPEKLGAIHFHRDDLEDAGWDVDGSFTVPAETRSGVYAVQLEIEGDRDVAPFFVRPPRGRATAEIAVLFPTFSYLAYANERLQEAPRDMEPGDDRGLPILPDRGDGILRRRHDLGLSVYDVHADGSGNCFSSAKRPILNMRPDHRNWQTHAPRALAADLYLVDWLDHLGLPFDAIDDGALHAEGQSLLDRYRVVVTGAHPEYWSEQMLDALEGYLDEGGRLMYLGGNGFYWVTSVDPHRPHVIEVRRGHNGTRPWEPRPGELRHATTGEVGGLWRYRGRGPNRVAGVGFSAQGYSRKAAPYHRLPDADDARAAWMFEGVPEGPIGDRGLIMDGAAGDEMDRADVALGTPPHALVVATSAGSHPDNVSVVVEDLLIAHPGVGGTRHPYVRSDVVFFETERGGAVFSGASMGWTGCLSAADYGNALARLTENVLRRFLDPRPL